MARKKELIDKKAKKKSEGCCRFCGESDYALLHVHRIVEGADGGRYTPMNTVVVCANCHCRCHDGQIKIDRYYFTTSGKWLLRCWIDDEEKWL